KGVNPGGILAVDAALLAKVCVNSLGSSVLFLRGKPGVTRFARVVGWTFLISDGRSLRRPRRRRRTAPLAPPPPPPTFRPRATMSSPKGSAPSVEVTALLADEEDRRLLASLYAAVARRMREEVQEVCRVTERSRQAGRVPQGEAPGRPASQPTAPQAQNAGAVAISASSKQLGPDDLAGALKSYLEWERKTLADVTKGLRLGDPATSRQGAAPGKDSATDNYESLAELRSDTRRGIAAHTVAALLSSQAFDARSRTFLRFVSQNLNMNFYPDVVAIETEVAALVLQAAKDNAGLSRAGGEEKRKREVESRFSRKCKLGIATAVGGLAIGLTGGLAAPLVGAGFATVLGGVGVASTAGGALIAHLAANQLLVAALFGGYGARNRNDKPAADVLPSDMSKSHIANRTAPVSDFEFRKIHHHNRLHVTIGISGWLTDRNEVFAPWDVFEGPGEGAGDLYALQWQTLTFGQELEAITALGSALREMLKAKAVAYVQTEIIKRTVFASLYSALWPIGLMKCAQLIDNPWCFWKPYF
ncbi:MAG: hypothetical protein BJ554DRAFT_5434, partial [Olpidium bornovanus]